MSYFTNATRIIIYIFLILLIYISKSKDTFKSKKIFELFNKQINNSTFYNQSLININFNNEVYNFGGSLTSVSSNSSNNNKTTTIIYYYYFNNDIIKGKINLPKEDILVNLQTIINSVKLGRKYEIQGEDFEIGIYPIINCLNENSTCIDFSECENIIKIIYPEISNETLTILQIEVKTKSNLSLTNHVEYAIFSENKSQIDLSICKNTKTLIYYKIKNSNTSIIKSFIEKDIDILNINDNFFNDICFPYSENGLDVILLDRAKYLYQNYSTCGNNCNYVKINKVSLNIICYCNIKTNISLEEESLNFRSFDLDNFKISSYHIINCFKLLFSSKGVSNNIGFGLFLSITIIHIPLYCYYFKSEIISTKTFITKEMKKNNFIINLNAPNKKNKNEEQKREKKNYQEKRKSVVNKIIKDETKLVRRKGKTKSVIINKNLANRLKLILNKDKNNSNNSLHLNSDNSSNKINSSKNIEVNSNISRNNKINRSKKKRFTVVNSNLNNNYFFNKKNKKLEKVKQKKYFIKESIKANYEEPKFPGYYNLILIDAKNTEVKKPPNSKFILTNYNFNEAKKYEIRSVWQIFLIKYSTYIFI